MGIYFAKPKIHTPNEAEYIMARLSDIIENFIKQALSDAEGVAEIQRNELAIRFNCVPSQINYVISTRFTHDRGYYVESRRGGGGFIRISKVNIAGDDNGGYLMHFVSAIGGRIGQRDADAFIMNFVDYDVITSREAALMRAAVSDKILLRMPQPERDAFRADILKNMLVIMAV
jgi:transcriptional regulator CtsR